MKPMEHGGIRRSTLLVLALLLFTAAGAVVSRRLLRDTHATSGSVRLGRVRSGTEVIAVFLVSTTCGAARYPALGSSLTRIRERLAEQAIGAHRRFYTIGVSLDEQPSAGLEFLSTFGEFDEVMAGGSWAGMGAVDFMLRSLPGPLSMPQLILLERDLRVESAGITVSADRVIMRKVGAVEIVEFSTATNDVYARLF